MRWISNHIATSAFADIVEQYRADPSCYILDVRNLVDKLGNSQNEVLAKIHEGVAALTSHERLIVCCDYGMSRSNAIAIGILSLTEKLSFAEAVESARQKIDQEGLKVEMLHTVFEALGGSTKQVGQEQKRVWITGANGFIGRQLQGDLSKDFLILSTPSSQINLLKDTLKADLFVKENKIDTIIHLANPKVYTTNKSLGDTLVMLKNVLDICRSNQVFLLYLSGWEVYSGYKSAYLLANETLPLYPKGTYGETKYLCEKIIKNYEAQFGLVSLILRSSPVFGVGAERPKLLYNFIQKALDHQPIWTHQYKNGSPGLDLLPVQDLSQAIKLLLSKGITGEINIGAGKLVLTRQIAVDICELTNSRSSLYYTEIDEYAANIIMDNTTIFQKTGWEPTHDYKQELKTIIDNYGHSHA
jgi:UDP-glucuronate decarboxylase